MTQQEWLARGQALATAQSQNTWDLGDWVNDPANIGHNTKKYLSAADAIGGRVKAGTLKVYAWVAREFPASIRIDVSFTHHHVVAALVSDPQARTEWLTRARDERMSAGALRKAIKAAQPAPTPDKTATDAPAPDEADDRDPAKRLQRMRDQYAKARGVDPQTVVDEALALYFKQDAVMATLKKYWWDSWVAKGRGFRDMWTRRHRRIDALCERMHDGDAVAIVKAYENEYGERFPYVYAKARTEFGGRLGDLTREDCHCGEFSEFNAEQSLAAQMAAAECAADAAPDETKGDTYPQTDAALDPEWELAAV
jgi:hypothetical protein